MPSSLFPAQNDGGIFGQVEALRSMAAGDASALYSQLYQSNPQFRTFADSVRGKTPEQAFREHGLDYNQYRNMR